MTSKQKGQQDKMFYPLKSIRYITHYYYGKISHAATAGHTSDAVRCFPSILLILLASSANAGGESFNITEVTPGNYLHTGIHAGIDDTARDDIANIGFIIGDRCVAIIDTGGSLDTGRKLLQQLREITDKPVCYVINTHVHFDHVLGNAVFKKENPQFIGHAQLADAITSNRDFFLEQFTSELGPEPSAELIIAPDIDVEETRTIDLGNRPVVLNAWPKSHTSTDLTVYDEKTRTLWAGDLVFRERIPVLDGSIKGWLRSLEEISTMDIAYTIPGHGQPGNGWEEVAAEQIEYLDILLQETRQAVAEGMFIEEAQDSVGMSQKDKWLLFEENHRRNVSKAFVELEWE